MKIKKKESSKNSSSPSNNKYDLYELAKQTLKERFPHGHPSFVDTLLQHMSLHSLKNASYTRGGDVLGNFRRVSNILKNYSSFPSTTPQGVAIIYMLKHLDKVMWDMTCGVAPSEENLNDIAIYINILNCMEKDRPRSYGPPQINKDPSV